jgi:hypothetical protein
MNTACVAEKVVFAEMVNAHNGDEGGVIGDGSCRSDALQTSCWKAFRDVSRTVIVLRHG